MDRSAAAVDYIHCPVEPAKPELYALIMEGDSMEPEYRHGDTVVIDPTLTPRHGDDVVVEQGDRHALRRLSVEPDGQYLVALNPAHPNRKQAVTARAQFHGVVIFSGRARRQA